MDVTVRPDPAKMHPVSQLRMRMGDVLTHLAWWSSRDTGTPQPRADAAGQDALAEIDVVLSQLGWLRSALVSEIREYQDACAARTDALLERLRQEASAVVELPDTD